MNKHYYESIEEVDKSAASRSGIYAGHLQEIYKNGGSYIEEDGYFQFIFEFGSGTDLECLECHSACAAHDFKRVTQLNNKRLTEYQSWKAGGLDSALNGIWHRLLNERLKQTELTIVFAVLNNFEQLGRDWCDIPIERLSFETRISKDMLKQIIPSLNISFLKIQLKHFNQYRFSLINTAET